MTKRWSTPILLSALVVSLLYSGLFAPVGPPGGGGASVTVRETDTVPTVSAVTTINVTNGSLTDNGGGSVTIATNGASNVTIGSSVVTGGTASSLLYVGAGPLLQQVSITGLVLGNGASAPSQYPGVTCTNQVLRVLGVDGAGTCVSITDAFFSGVLGLTKGGTNQSAWTASRCVQVNAGGTALESAAAACGSGGGSGYATVQDEATTLTQRATINFTGVGVTCTDDAGNTRTNCAIGTDSSAQALAPNLVTVNAGNSPYTATASNLTLACDTSAAGRTINLPVVGAYVFMVYNTGPNSCTINRGAADTILGATSLVLTNNDQSVTLSPVSATNWGVF